MLFKACVCNEYSFLKQNPNVSLQFIFLHILHYRFTFYEPQAYSLRSFKCYISSSKSKTGRNYKTKEIFLFQSLYCFFSDAASVPMSNLPVQDWKRKSRKWTTDKCAELEFGLIPPAQWFRHNPCNLWLEGIIHLDD